MCWDMPVSGVKMQKPSSVIEINRAPNSARRLYPFMDDTYLDTIERSNELINELYRNLKDRALQLDNLRKRIKNQDKKKTQTLEDLGRYVHLTSTVRRMKQKLMCMSVVHKVPKWRRVKLSRNNRQIMVDSQDNLCQAVQEMQLNSESFVRKSECMQSGDKFLAKVDSPSEVAEDLSKLCMKD